VKALNAGRRIPFFEDPEGIHRRRAAPDGAHQVVVPASLQQQVLHLEHDATLAGHPGESRMYAAMRRYYYWVGLAANVVSYVRKCDSCVRQRVRPLARRSPLTLFPATMPFQDIAVDLYGPLARTAARHRFILVITDRFTNLVRALPMDGTTAVACASAVLDYWVAAYGPPDRLLSDRGPQFTSHFWGQVCNLLSIKPKVTSPSHPETNEQTERFNRTMHTILNHYLAEHPRSWDQLLGALTLAYDSRPHRSTGVAPLELVNPMGVSSWAFKDVSRTRAYPITAQRGTAAEKRAQADLLTRVVQLVSQMRATLKGTQGRYKRDHDRRLALRAEKLTVGGVAWLRDHAKKEGAGGTLPHVARGLYRVVSADGPTVLLDVDGEHRRENVAHVVRASGAAVPGPAQHPALRTARSFHWAEADGQRYSVYRMIGVPGRGARTPEARTGEVGGVLPAVPEELRFPMEAVVGVAVRPSGRPGAARGVSPAVMLSLRDPVAAVVGVAVRTGGRPGAGGGVSAAVTPRLRVPMAAGGGVALRPGGRPGANGGVSPAVVLGRRVPGPAGVGIAPTTLAAVGAPHGVVAARRSTAATVSLTGRRPRAVIPHAGTAAHSSVHTVPGVAAGAAGAANGSGRPTVTKLGTGHVGVAVMAFFVPAAAHGGEGGGPNRDIGGGADRGPWIGDPGLRRAAALHVGVPLLPGVVRDRGGRLLRRWREIPLVGQGEAGGHRPGLLRHR